MSAGQRYPDLPDVRDGLTHQERVVLYVLHETQKERPGRNVPTAMRWGRVCEHFTISPEDLSLMLTRLGAMGDMANPFKRATGGLTDPPAED